MLNNLKPRIKSLLTILVALTPAIASMFLLHWLIKMEIWIPETPHRDKMTIAILLGGLGTSFLLQSYFFKRRKK